MPTIRLPNASAFSASSSIDVIGASSFTAMVRRASSYQTPSCSMSSPYCSR
jgi:hypothetical protein